MRIELGGRAFVPVETFSVRHHDATMRLLARAGLVTPARLDEEELLAYGRRILLTIIEAGIRVDLVSHIIVPEGVEKWTPEVSQSTADFLNELTSARDKEVLDDVTVSALVPFFETIVASGTATPTSSGPRRGRTAGRRRTGSGRRWFARSPGTITTRLRGSLTGLWRRLFPLTRPS